MKLNEPRIPTRSREESNGISSGSTSKPDNTPRGRPTSAETFATRSDRAHIRVPSEARAAFARCEALLHNDEPCGKSASRLTASGRFVCGITRHLDDEAIVATRADVWVTKEDA